MAKRKSKAKKEEPAKSQQSSTRSGSGKSRRPRSGPARSSRRGRREATARGFKRVDPSRKSGAGGPPVPARRQGLTRFLPEIVSAAVIALMVAFVYHRAVHYFFSQDDFMSLWIARQGPETFWRILSSYAYFGAISAIFGLNAIAFHVLSLMFHVANALVVFFIARALYLGRGPSLLASALFALHPSLFVPLYAISSIGEILSCFFALLAALYVLQVSRPGGPISILAVSLLFLASLLSKETTILFPLLVLPIYAARKMRLRRAVPLFVTLTAIAAAYGAFLYAANIFGIREASPGAGAYQLTVGSELVTSLQTYFKWIFNLVESWRNEPFNVLDERALPWLLVGIGAFGVLLVGSGGARARTVFCVSWFFVMLLPVVPLTGHPYHYYLYIPLAGLVPAFAILLAQRVKSAQWQMVLSILLMASMLLHSAMLVSKIETATVGDSGTRQEPTFDRAIVSGNLISDLRQRELPQGAKLLLISPLSDIRAGKLREHPHIVKGGPYWDSNVRSAIADGIAIKLFFPQVDSVAFAEGLAPGFEDFLPISYAWNGHLRRIQPARTWTEAGVRHINENPSFALACFRNAVRQDSLYADAHYHLARLSLSEARFTEAARALRKFLAVARADARMDEARRILRGLEARGY